MRCVTLAGKTLTFGLGDESCGFKVQSLREIIRHAAVTALPQMPPYVRDVVILAGAPVTLGLAEPRPAAGLAARAAKKLAVHEALDPSAGWP